MSTTDPVIASSSPSSEEKIIGAILEILRADPAIIASNITVWAPEGDPEQLPPYMPDEDELPLIRLVDSDYPSDWNTQETHKGHLKLRFELWAPRHHYADRFRLLDILRGAVFPQDSAARASVRAKVESAGNVINATLKTGGSDVVYEGSDKYAQLSVAELVVHLQIKT